MNKLILKRKKIGKNKGITLVALIVTIVIMLILTAVGITIAVKGNLFGIAKETVEKTGENYRAEQNLGEQIEIGGNIYNSAQDYVNQNEEESEPMPTISAGVYATENSQYIDTSVTPNRYAVIPAGFTVSSVEAEKTIDSGLVIYEGNGEINEQNIENAKATRNQFVWIPIDNINDMYICQAKTDSNGTCELAINEDDEIYCKNHKAEDSVKSKQMAGYLYSEETYREAQRVTKYTENAEYREPAIIIGYDEKSYDAAQKNGVYTNLNKIATILEDNTNYKDPITFKDTLQKEYNEIAKSILKNGGFWCGRYETSGLSQGENGYNAKAIAGADNYINGSISSVDWYYMYAQQKKYKLNDESAGTTMINATAYDQVIKFVATDPNYNPFEFVNTNFYDGEEPYSTGSNNDDIANNIYDLECNVCVWTTGANREAQREGRGGDYYGGYSASSFYKEVPDSKYNDNLGTLMQLYIK